MALDEAMSLVETKTKVVKIPKTSVNQFQEIPADFQDMLNQNPAAALTMDNFSPSNRKEYLDWIAEAKTETTRTKRLHLPFDAGFHSFCACGCPRTGAALCFR